MTPRVFYKINGMPEHLKVKVTALSLWWTAFMKHKMELAVM